MKKTIIYITLILIGVAIGVLIMHIPRLRYDINGNGQIDIGDMYKFSKYYINY